MNYLNKLTNSFPSNQKGAGLLELLVAVGVFALGILTFSHLFVAVHTSSTYNINESEALDLTREGLEAVRSIRNNDFEDLEVGEYELTLVENKWTLSELGEEEDPATINERYKRKIEVSNYEKDEKRKEVVSTVSWNDGEESVSLTEHLTFWQEEKYTLTMKANPDEGGAATDQTDASPYPEGTTVNISADPEVGYVFDEWSASAGTFYNTNAVNTNFTMPDENVMVTAHFSSE